MLKSKAVTIDSIQVGDSILLNDVKARETVDAFYQQFYVSDPLHGLHSTELQIGHVVEITRIADAYRIEVRTLQHRKIFIEEYSGKLLSVYSPEQISIEDLAHGDWIALRGDYSPTRMSESYDYALIARRYGFISQVLKVRKTLFGNYRMTVLFGGVKKVSITVDPGVQFESSLAYSS